MATTKRKHVKVQPIEVVIPDKIYFRIGEVSELAALPTYVLRFWETEFPQLKPTKSSTGQRMYRRKDVEHVLQIRKLLYEDGFTIAGAREKLREEMRQNRAPKSVVPEPQLVAPEAAAPTPEPAPMPAPEPGVEAVAPAPVTLAAPVAVLPMMPQAEQETLPLFASAQEEQPLREPLRRLRQQLREVLVLLS